MLYGQIMSKMKKNNFKTKNSFYGPLKGISLINPVFQKHLYLNLFKKIRINKILHDWGGKKYMKKISDNEETNFMRENKKILFMFAKFHFHYERKLALNFM